MLIGCPIYKRAWILPLWYEHVLTAANEADIHDLAFVFVLDESDQETLARIEQTFRFPTKLVILEQALAQDDHQWNSDRFHEMVLLRNELLNTVRAIDPDLFLSLDSDILIHPNSIKNMIESAQKFDAVGGKTFMMERGILHPSYAMLGQNGNLIRSDSTGVFSVDCIMAIKLMNPKAYRVDYKFDDFGEDIGWSKTARESGISLGWDGRVTSKHVMKKSMLNVVDERCGF